MCTTERAGAHSLQFGTYALWTAGLLAALAGRPVPSCVLSLTRGVNDQPPSDMCSGQAAPRSPRRARTLRPDRLRDAWEFSPRPTGGMTVRVL